MKKVAQEIFTKKKLIDFVVNEMIGRFVGFMVGMWTTSLFSKVVYEKKGLKNFFGLAPRKKVVVNTTPEWLQVVISAIVGFIVLELINYFFKHKLYVPIWEFIKQKYEAVTNKKSLQTSKDYENDSSQQEWSN